MNSHADLARRLDNLLIPGVIAEVDHSRALCRVQSGRLLTAWLPWFPLRAGVVSHWSPPTIGEQCLVLSPGGEPAAGFVLLGLYSHANPPPADSSSLHRLAIADGALIEYDHAAHALRAQLPAGGTAELVAPGGVSITGDVTIQGTVTVSEDVVADGISLVGHTHGSVQPGSGSTGAPQ
jgi:phage baseplate assembly protein V